MFEAILVLAGIITGLFVRPYFDKARDYIDRIVRELGEIDW